MYCPECGWKGIVTNKRNTLPGTMRDKVARLLEKNKQMTRSEIMQSARAVNSDDLTIILNQLSLDGKITIKKLHTADKPTTIVEWEEK